MSQNKVDKVIKNVLPVGSYVSFSNDIDPNNLFEGNWIKLGSYTNIIWHNSVELAKDISGTTAKSKTGLLGSYFDKTDYWYPDFLGSCPGGYYPVARLNVYGYTGSSNVITVYLNNKEVNLSSWGPSTFTRSYSTGWWAWSSLTAENTTYNIGNDRKGLNLYYAVSSPDANWRIQSIKLDFGFAPYNKMVQWARNS